MLNLFVFNTALLFWVNFNLISCNEEERSSVADMKPIKSEVFSSSPLSAPTAAAPTQPQRESFKLPDLFFNPEGGPVKVIPPPQHPQPVTPATIEPGKRNAELLNPAINLNPR